MIGIFAMFLLLLAMAFFSLPSDSTIINFFMEEIYEKDRFDAFGSAVPGHGLCRGSEAGSRRRQ
jgi:hypothetical protein